MSTSSLIHLFTAGLACLAPFASAYTQPVGAAPVGNPFSAPGLGSIVPVGTPYTVTWTPTTDGSVTLLLLKGPASNAVPQYAIVEKIPNTGTYSWTPATDLAPGTTGYGLELIDDETGQYQYTTQFGISNPAYTSSSSSSSTTSVTSTSSTSSQISTSSTSSISTTSTVSVPPVPYTGSTSSSVSLSTSSIPTVSTTSTPPVSVTTSAPVNYNATTPLTTTSIVSTSTVSSNGSIVYPTGSTNVPASLTTTARASGTGSDVKSTSTSVLPAYTGAAMTMATSFAGLAVAAGAAVFAF